MREDRAIPIRPAHTPRANPLASLPVERSPREASLGRGPGLSGTSDRRRRLMAATFDLARQRPDLSARYPLWPWQVLALVCGGGVAIGGWFVAPGPTIATLTAGLTMTFIGVVLVRLVALFELARPISGTARHPRLPDALLPTYSVLVPMYDEAEVLPRLIAGLTALDYPTGKLDLMLVLEEADDKTRAALATLILPGHMRAIIVPDGLPRTKPKATNYALPFATGDFVVVFDAEDRPEADQLRRAAAAFAVADGSLACVQARLNVYNPHDSWFSRQFTVEYCAQFDAILPALARMRLPVPLGGTSNHFPRQLLQRIGAWDPFNVTEDADLGVRLARMGLRTQVLDSTTWEEAPVTFGQWLPQRTRWLKGWFQTYLVHTRRPWLLLRQLGVWRGIGFHLFLGGLLLSTLVHPLFYLLLIWNFAVGDGLAVPEVFGGGWLWLASGGTLVLGYLSAITIGIIAAGRRGHGLLGAALQMPLCWLLISLAAYRALWQLWRQPFLWEKTAHGRGSTS